MPAKYARLRCKFHELLIILLQASLAFAQTAFINGSVKDPSGAAISGAEVRLSAGASSASTTTDSAHASCFPHKHVIPERSSMTTLIN
jgi:hypothetical protein